MNISKENLEEILEDLIDYYGDFYFTKNNLRLYIKDNYETLWEDLCNGDSVYFSKDSNGFAVGFVIGYADKSPRKYIKLLASQESRYDQIIKEILVNNKCDLYIKVKKNNPLVRILKTYGFEFKGGRGKEILLMKKMESNDA